MAETHEEVEALQDEHAQPCLNDDEQTLAEDDSANIDEDSENDEIDRRDAIRALTKYSAAGGAAVVVLSSKGALSMGALSICNGSSPPAWCP